MQLIAYLGVEIEFDVPPCLFHGFFLGGFVGVAFEGYPCMTRRIQLTRVNSLPLAPRPRSHLKAVFLVERPVETAW